MMASTSLRMAPARWAAPKRSKFAKFAGAASMLLLVCAALLAGPVAARAAEQWITPETLRQWQEQGRAHLLIDVRFETQFALGHLQGAINVPAPLLPHKALPKDRDIVLYDADLSGLTARRAAEALAVAGTVDAGRVVVLRGGLRAWEAAGFASDRPAGEYDAERESLITADDLREAIRIGMPVQVLDLRDAEAFRAKAVPGAFNVPVLKPVKARAEAKSDSLREAAQLPKAAIAREKSAAGLKEADREAVEIALAKQVVEALGKRRESLRQSAAAAAAASAPTVLMDDGSGLAGRLVPRLARFGQPGVLAVERGMVAWEANQKSTPEFTTEAISHGKTSYSRTEVLQRLGEKAAQSAADTAANSADTSAAAPTPTPLAPAASEPKAQ